MERWNGLRLPGWRFWWIFGMRKKTLQGWKKNKVYPRIKWGSNIRDGWYHNTLNTVKSIILGVFFGLNPLKEGSYQSKQGSLGACMCIFIYIFYICITNTCIVPLPPFLQNQVPNWSTGRAFNKQLPRSSWHEAAPRSMMGSEVVIGWGLQGSFFPLEIDHQRIQVHNFGASF